MNIFCRFPSQIKKYLCFRDKARVKHKEIFSGAKRASFTRKVQDSFLHEYRLRKFAEKVSHFKSRQATFT